MLYQRILALLTITSMLSLAGCGGSDMNLARVKGKVTMNGQPVVGATVSFIPDSSKDTEGPMSAGILDDQGEFTLTTSDGIKGAIIGFHKVTVTCPFDPSAGSSQSGDGAIPSPTTPCNVPAKYSGYAETDLSAEVKKSGNDFTFDLQPN